MNRQEVFNTVAKHLLTQNAKAQGTSGTCSYRGENDTKCAVGVLIKDEVYSPSIEGGNVHASRVQAALKASGIDLGPGDTIFLGALQGIHDGRNPLEWQRALNDFAYDFDLQPYQP